MAAADHDGSGLDGDACWPRWPRGLAPARGETFVWTLDLAAAGDARPVSAARALLSSDEIERADRFRFPRDRDRFILTRGTLRRILAAAAGEEAQAVAFGYGGAGKPAIVGRDDIVFSVSHSGDLALIAVAIRDNDAFELGIDIEAARPVPDALAIAARFFTREEAGRLAGLPAPARDREFMRIWVTKEACVKADGRGLGALEELNTRAASGRPLPWSIRMLDVRPGYVAAMAHSPSDRVVTQWTAPEHGDNPPR